MARPRTVTHAYRLDGGWRKLARRRLTPDYARRLLQDGFTLVRTSRLWHPAHEHSLTQYVKAQEAETSPPPD